MKLRNISPGYEIDPHRYGSLATGVILGQSTTNVVGSHADDRIRGGLVAYRSPKQFDANEPFRQALVVSCKSPLDDQLEKIPASIAAGKTVAGKDRREFSFDCGGLLCREVARLGLGWRESHFLYRRKKAISIAHS